MQVTPHAARGNGAIKGYWRGLVTCRCLAPVRYGWLIEVCLCMALCQSTLSRHRKRHIGRPSNVSKSCMKALATVRQAWFVCAWP